MSKLSGNNRNNYVGGTPIEDTLYGQGGNDTLKAFTGNDILFGGAGNDFVEGGAGNDTLYGNSGQDFLRGVAGSDKLYGGSNNDTLVGGEGNDFLYGNKGNDRIRGGAKSDKIYGGTGADNMDGGDGNDIFFQHNNNDSDTITGGNGIDTIDYSKAKINEQLIVHLDSGVITYNGQTDNTNTIERIIGSSRNNDLLSATEDTNGVIINLELKTISGANAGFSQFRGFEYAAGGSGNDVLTGDNRNNQLSGSDGNDTLIGGLGNDTLMGGSNNDTYTGYSNSGFGTDTLHDTAGTDTLILTSFDVEDDITAWLTNTPDGEEPNITDLIIVFANGSRLIIENYFDGASADVTECEAGTGCIETINFADAVTFDFDDVLGQFVG